MRETWVQSLGWEDPQRRAQQPTPVFLPGEFRGQRSLAGYSPCGCKESDTTEQLSFRFSRSYIPVNLDPSVQFSTVAQSCLTIPWIAARQASLSITNSRSSLKLMSIESVMPSSHLILCRPLLLLLQHQSVPVSQLFAWGGQSTGVSTSASVSQSIGVSVSALISINLYLLLLLLLLCTYRVLSYFA